ncbi:hypothetical protein PMAYCL1PPCAC_07828, partial [Pristionchus mayeri]
IVVCFSGPGMSGVNDLDLSGLSNFKLTRHTRNVANLLDVCAESSRRMAKRAAAGIVTNQDRTTSKFCDYLITMFRRLARVSVAVATVSAVVVAFLIPSLAVWIQHVQSAVDNELIHCRWSAVELWKEYETLYHQKGVAGRLKRETYFGHFREPEDNETETTVEEHKTGSYADKAYLMHQEVFMPARSRPVPAAYGRGGYDQSAPTTTTLKPMEKSAGYSTGEEMTAFEGGPLVQHHTTNGYEAAPPQPRVTTGEVRTPPSRKPPTSPGYTPSRVDPYSPAYTPPRLPYTATYMGTTHRTPGNYPGYGNTITTGRPYNPENPYEQPLNPEPDTIPKPQEQYPPSYPDYHTPGSPQFPQREEE